MLKRPFGEIKEQKVKSFLMENGCDSPKRFDSHTETSQLKIGWLFSSYIFLPDRCLWKTKFDSKRPTDHEDRSYSATTWRFPKRRHLCKKKMETSSILGQPVLDEVEERIFVQPSSETEVE